MSAEPLTAEVRAAIAPLIAPMKPSQSVDQSVENRIEVGMDALFDALLRAARSASPVDRAGPTWAAEESVRPNLRRIINRLRTLAETEEPSDG